MKAPDFAYVKAQSVAEAIAALEQAGDGGRVLAGGQSLMPMLNFRAAEPDILVDINHVPGLCGIEDLGEALRIGALVRHCELERSDLVARHVPLLTEAIAHVAHQAIRTRGTIGGSLALADPAAELPACALALDATLIAQGPSGERRIAAGDFFRGAYETALGEAELLIAVEVAKAQGRRHVFREIVRRHGDYAMIGLILTVDGQSLGDARVVWFGIGDRPIRAGAVEEALSAGADVAAAIDGLQAHDDLNGSAAMKRHLAKVLMRRAVADLEGAGS